MTSVKIRHSITSSAMRLHWVLNYFRSAREKKHPLMFPFVTECYPCKLHCLCYARLRCYRNTRSVNNANPFPHLRHTLFFAKPACERRKWTLSLVVRSTSPCEARPPYVALLPLCGVGLIFLLTYFLSHRVSVGHIAFANASALRFRVTGSSAVIFLSRYYAVTENATTTKNRHCGKCSGPACEIFHNAG